MHMHKRHFFLHTSMKSAAGLVLHESSIRLQKNQSILESSNFCLTTSRPVLVDLWLGNALVLNLLEVLGNCGKLDLNVLLAAMEFSVGICLWCLWRSWRCIELLVC